MNNTELREELEILKGASLVDSKAPVRLDTGRSRDFVRRTLEGDEKEHKSSLADTLVGLFRRPAVAWGSVTAFAVACASALFFFLPHNEESYTVLPGDVSVHASIDSVSNSSADSLDVEIMDVEILSVE